MDKEILLFLLVASVFANIPIIGKYVNVCYTLLHEFGHALFSILLGGRVESISLFSNTEGVAVTTNSNWLARIITSLAGYPFASFCSLVMFWAILHGFEDYILIGLFVIVCITFLVWIRNLYGLIWIISFGGIIWLFISGYLPQFKEYFILFISSVVFVQSIYNSFIILYLSIFKPLNAGDTTNLAKSTLIIPPFVWGLLFAIQSVYFAYKGLELWY